MRQQLLGCAVDNLSMDETVDRVAQFVASGRPHQHVVVNVDKLVKADREPALARVIDACDLVNADGMPVVWASRLLGQPLKERVAGIDLFERLLGEAASRGWRVYFLGATEPVLQAAMAEARRRHPALQLAGARHGYWSAEEEPQVVQAVADAGAQLLFVAISSPKKEIFLNRHQAAMAVPFAMGVGGSFDVLAGLTRRAPRWMQGAGLEWFWRFLQEPRRMFRRYFVEDMRFVALLLRALRQRRAAAVEWPLLPTPIE